MNKIFTREYLIIITLLLSTQIFAQQSITFDQSNTELFSINSHQTNDFTASFNFNELQFSNFSTNEIQFIQLNIEGFSKSYNPGEPDLPVFVKIISVPTSVELNLNILNYDSNTYDLNKIGINNIIKPAIQSISKSDDENDIEYIVGETYKTDKYTTNPVISLKEVGIMRGLKLYELTYSPISYNAIKQKIIVKNSANIKISWENSSFNADQWDFTNQHNEYLTTTKTKTINAGETFVIVSPTKYKETLQPFVKWKKQQGFNIIESYIGEQITSNNKDVIKAYLKNLYENPSEGDQAPMYLLIVGDVIDIPTWNGTTDSHVTDLYYVEYTNDFLPELYYGRFSATTTEQLQIIIDKTLFVEKGSGGKNDYQNNHLLISGVDASYAPVYGNGAINYFLKYYSLEEFGVTNNYYLYGSGSPITSNNSEAKQAILEDFSDGTGIAYYTAHCSTYGWSSPEFEIQDISSVNNKDKYPLMIGNCCESLKFNLTSFGEEIVRAKDKGAVAYIGATNYSYWDEDYFWGIGFTSNIISDPVYDDTDLGAFDSWFHTHNEVEEVKSYTVGQILNIGNMAVQSSSSTLKSYYWEVYQIMGDPSLVPAKYKTSVITAKYDTIMIVGQQNLTVTTEKNAIVTLMENSELLATGSANSEGICELNFMPLQNIGENRIEIVVSLPDYSPLIDLLNIISPDGPYLVYQDIIIDDSNENNNGLADYGETISIHLQIENFGTETATNVKSTINSNSEWLSTPLDNAEISIADVESGVTITSINFYNIELEDDIPNNTEIKFIGQLNYSDTLEMNFSFNLLINGPFIDITNWIVDKSGVGNLDGIIDSDESASIDVSFSNSGNYQVSNTTILFTSPNNNLITVLTDEQLGGGFNVNESKSFEIQVKGGSNIFPGTQIDLNYTILAGDNRQFNFSGSIPITLGGKPEYILSNDTVEIISGYFYDTGGANGTYDNSESYTMTFIPHIEGQGLMIDFSEFSVEPNGKLCYDKLKIYDGIDINAPLIGSFCDSNIKNIIQSQNTTGALTFKFTSDDSQTEDGWNGFITSSDKYTVTVNVSNGVELIDSTIVEFGNNTDTTSINGSVLFSNVLANSEKFYAIEKEGYFPLTGTLGEINSDTTITVLIKKLPDICFTVSENINKLDSVEIRFDDRTLYTDENGFVNFYDVEPGSKTFRTSYKGFNDTTGIIVVGEIDVCYYIKLTRKPMYNLTFIISDKFGLVKDAEIDVEGRLGYSDENGVVIFDSLYTANFDYTISKAGYYSSKSSLNITDSNVVKEIELEFITYSATFNVTNNSLAIDEALITIGDETQTTSISGQAVFSTIIPDSSIAYTIAKTGFNNYNGTFNLINENIELDISLIPVGISDNSNIIYKIYPNPLHNYSELNIRSSKSISEIKIFNYTGKLFVTKTNVSKEFIVDVSEFASGIYILQLKIDDKLYFEKVIIE